jgi:small-conductance mechanosensitive channel
MSDDDLGNVMQIASLLRPSRLLLLLAGVLTLMLIVRFLRRGGEQLARRFPSRRLVTMQAANIVSFVIYMLGAIVLFFGVLAPPRELMIAVAGGLAVAVGLSLKDVVASLVAGIILLFDRPFNVGDRVSFQGEYGEITSIGLRAVRLQTLDDNTVTIPNAKFITDAVSSANFGALTMMVTVDLYLDPTTDLPRARELAYEAVVTSRYAFLRKPVALVLEQEVIGNVLATKMTVKAYVLDVVFEKAFASDILLRCTSAFRDGGIEWARLGQPQPQQEPAPLVVAPA